jgi:hypothetical protein
MSPHIKRLACGNHIIGHGNRRHLLAGEIGGKIVHILLRQRQRHGSHDGRNPTSLARSCSLQFN